MAITADAVTCVILAAGNGSRLRSNQPKALLSIAGRSCLAHLLSSIDAAGYQPPVVVEGPGQPLSTLFSQGRFVTQSTAAGTAAAVETALAAISTDYALIMPVDAPLLQPHTLQAMCASIGDADAVILTQRVDDPFGYGRIIRNSSGDVIAIVEENDADDQQRRIDEINTGIILVRTALLRQQLPQISTNNSKGERYLTDIIALLSGDGRRIVTASAQHDWEAAGINTQRQRALLERRYQYHQACLLLDRGVTIVDPHRFDVRGEVTVGRDVTIDINVIIEGQVVIEDDVAIGAGCLIRNSHIGRGSVILPYSVIDGATIGDDNRIGPFSRLRPGTRSEAAVRIGNFVETKQTVIGAHSKASHLSYLGDATIGVQCNIGAGVITCNYDGRDKHQTTIADGAFIGSNVALVAPVRIGNGSYVAAGSTITEDIKDDVLAIARARATIKHKRQHAKE